MARGKGSTTAIMKLHRNTSAWVVVIAALSAMLLPASVKGQERVTRACVPEDDASSPAERRVRSAWFPAGKLFSAPLAAMKEPRFYASGRRVRFNGESVPTMASDGWVSAGMIGLGVEFGIWARRDAKCDGLQVGLMSGVFSQFHLTPPSHGLLNSDFVFGPQLTYRHGGTSLRARLYHQSSHLGDDLLRRAEERGLEIDGRDPSFEGIDLLVSTEGSWWRTYGGAGYIYNSIPSLNPWKAEGGLELRSPARRWGAVEVLPTAAIHVDALEERGWGTTTSLMGGVSLRQPRAGRGARILITYMNGFLPFGQFFTDVEMDSYGFQLEFIL